VTPHPQRVQENVTQEQLRGAHACVVQQVHVILALLVTPQPERVQLLLLYVTLVLLRLPPSANVQKRVVPQCVLRRSHAIRLLVQHPRVEMALIALLTRCSLQLADALFRGP